MGNPVEKNSSRDDSAVQINSKNLDETIDALAAGEFLSHELLAEENNTDKLLDALRSELDEGRLARVRRLLAELSPPEVALLIESLPRPQRQIIWDLTSVDDDGDVLLHVNDEVRAQLIRDTDNAELVSALDGMALDDLADIIDELPEAVTHQVLQSMGLQERQRLESVRRFDEDTAGGLADPSIVTIRGNVNVDVVLRYLRLRGELPGHTDSLFVVDRKGNFAGKLQLSVLLTADVDATVSDIMNSDIEPISAETPATDVARIFENLDLISAPVITEDGNLLGRITIDDVVDVIRDEAEHAVMARAGLDEEGDMFAPVVPTARRRAVWLGLNLVTAFISVAFAMLFTDSVEQVPALAIMMPVVASMGGIAGSQTLTLVIRGLALGQLGTSNIRKLFSRELAVVFINAVLWAFVAALATIIWLDELMIGVAILVALVVNMLFGVAAGVFIPRVLKRFGADPALAGGVLLTTVTDTVGFVVFLGVGTALILS